MGVLMADTCWADTVVLLATIIGLLYYWSTSTYNYWNKLGVKTAPNITPFFGNLKDAVTMKKQFGLFFTDMYWDLDGERYGGYYRIREPSLMIRDPALIKDVMVHNFSSFYDNGVHASEKNEPMFAFNLFGMKGATWKYARSKLSPMFSTGKIRGMFPLILEVCEELKQHIQRKIESDNPEFDAKNVAANYTTDVVASCAFGLKCNSLKDENNKFRDMGKQIMTPSKIRGFVMLVLFFIPTLSSFFGFLGINFVPESVTKYFRKLVNDAFEFREKNNYVRNDMIQLLMQLKKSGEVQDDDEDVKNPVINKDEEGKIEFKGDVLTAQAVGFFLDGYETSSIAMSYAMHELIINPKIQTKLREELHKIVDKNEGVLTYDGLRECGYLDQVFHETLRKHPAAGVFNKMCTKRYQIPGTDVKLEIGTPIAIPVHALHHDPKYYPEPSVFDPDRFTEENKKKRVPVTYLGFGEGPRQCVGIRFAMAQVKAALATVILNFELQASEKTREPVEIDKCFFMNSPVGGLHMKALPLKY